MSQFWILTTNTTKPQRDNESSMLIIFSSAIQRFLAGRNSTEYLFLQRIPGKFVFLDKMKCADVYQVTAFAHFSRRGRRIIRQFPEFEPRFVKFESFHVTPRISANPMHFPRSNAPPSEINNFYREGLGGGKEVGHRRRYYCSQSVVNFPSFRTFSEAFPPSLSQHGPRSREEASFPPSGTLSVSPAIDLRPYGSLITFSRANIMFLSVSRPPFPIYRELFILI